MITSRSAKYICPDVKLKGNVLTAEQLEVAAAGLNDGDSAFINPLLSHYLGMARNIASKYVRTKRFEDDLLQVSMVAMWEALKEVAEGNTQLIVQRFIAYRAHRACRKFLDEFSNVVRVPESTNRHHWHITGKPLQRTEESFTEYGTRGDTNLHFLFQSILQCCHNSLEEDIIRLRSYGHTDDEVAIILGISRSEVNRIRSTIERRFEDSANA